MHFFEKRIKNHQHFKCSTFCHQNHCIIHKKNSRKSSKFWLFDSQSDGNKEVIFTTSKIREFTTTSRSLPGHWAAQADRPKAGRLAGPGQAKWVAWMAGLLRPQLHLLLLPNPTVWQPFLLQPPLKPASTLSFKTTKYHSASWELASKEAYVALLAARIGAR